MIGDPVSEEPGAGAGALPALEPVLVVGEADVDGLVRSARADLAKLSLELRTLQHRAGGPAEVSAGPDTTGDRVDLPTARELRRSLEARLAARRPELLAEVDEAHAAAARRVLDAQTEAAALVDAAREELLLAVSGFAGAARSDPPPASPPPTTEPNRARSLRGRFFHPDVLLPLTALLIAVLGWRP